MATANLTATPTTLDTGTSASISILNTGATRVTVVNGPQTTFVRAGQEYNQPVFGAVTAVVPAEAGGSGAITYTAAGARGDVVTYDELTGAIAAERTSERARQTATYVPAVVVTGTGIDPTGVADSTAAIQALLDALPATGGSVYFPPGRYKVTGLTVSKPGTRVYGAGCDDTEDQDHGLSTITMASTTATMFTVTAHNVTFEGLSLRQTLDGATAGAGIAVTAAGNGNRYRNMSFRGFYIGVDVQYGTSWFMDSCIFRWISRYGVKIQNIAVPDGGDMTIESCIFLAQGSAAAAIRQESGGGLKIRGCKVNGTATHRYDYGLDAQIAQNTSVLTVTGNSFENIGITAIRGSNSGGSFAHASIVGNEFMMTAGAATRESIFIYGWSNVVVVGNVLVGSNSFAAITFNAVSGGSVGMNRATGFSLGEYSEVGGTVGVRYGTPGIWAAYTATLSSDGTQPVLGTGGTVSARYIQQPDKTVHGEIIVQFGSAGTSAGTGTYIVNLPVAPSTALPFHTYGTWYAYHAGSFSTGLLNRYSGSNAQMLISGGNVNAAFNQPWAWAANDVLVIRFTYEAA